MDTGKVVLIGGAVLVGGFLVISLVNSMNQQAVVAQTQGSNTVNTGSSNEGNIIFNALAGLGIGIGGVIAGVNAGNRPGGSKTPSQNTQPPTPANNTTPPSPSAPAPSFNFDWGRLPNMRMGST